MMLNFLRFLAAHGIDPEVPLILGGVLMGICLTVFYYEIQMKREAEYRIKHIKWLLSRDWSMANIPSHAHTLNVLPHVHTIDSKEVDQNGAGEKKT